MGMEKMEDFAVLVKDSGLRSVYKAGVCGIKLAMLRPTWFKWVRSVTGFTFIETIVSMLIFSIIVLMGLSYQTLGKDLEMQSKNTLFALQVAQNQIENMRTQDYTSIIVGTQVLAPTKNNESGLWFSPTVVVTLLSPPGTKKIAVTVTWQTTFSLTLNTIIAPAY